MGYGAFLVFSFCPLLRTLSYGTWLLTIHDTLHSRTYIFLILDPGLVLTSHKPRDNFDITRKNQLHVAVVFEGEFCVRGMLAN